MAYVTIPNFYADSSLLGPDLIPFWRTADGSMFHIDFNDLYTQLDNSIGGGGSSLWSAGSNNEVYYNDGSVGIGEIPSTETKLTVNSGTGNNVVHFKSSDSIASIHLSDNATGNSEAIRRTGDFLRFYSDGSLGLYVDKSSTVIYHAGSLRSQTTSIGTAFSEQILGNIAGDASTPAFSINGDTDTGIFQAAANILGFTTAGAERARININELKLSVPLRVDDGSVGSPSISFNNNSNLGIYRPSSNVMRISVSGVDALETNESNVITKKNLLITEGSISAPGLAFEDDPSFGFMKTTSASNFQTIADGVEILRFTSIGTVGFKPFLGNNGSATAPIFSFSSDANTGFYRQAADNIGVTTGGTERFRFVSGGTFHADADVIAYSTTISDRRLKTKIIPLEKISSLEKIMQLNPIEFEYKRKPDIKHFGFIAQDIQKIIPDIVAKHELMQEDDKEYLTLHQEELIPYLTASIQEQQKVIQNLQDANKKLTAKIDKIFENLNLN